VQCHCLALAQPRLPPVQPKLNLDNSLKVSTTLACAMNMADRYLAQLRQQTPGVIATGARLVLWLASQDTFAASMETKILHVGKPLKSGPPTFTRPALDQGCPPPPSPP
jgi:hypothetical protein